MHGEPSIAYGVPEGEVGDLAVFSVRPGTAGGQGLYGGLASFSPRRDLLSLLGAPGLGLRGRGAAIGAQAGFVEEADGKADRNEEQQTARILDVPDPQRVKGWEPQIRQRDGCQEGREHPRTKAPIPSRENDGRVEREIRVREAPVGKDEALDRDDDGDDGHAERVVRQPRTWFHVGLAGRCAPSSSTPSR